MQWKREIEVLTPLFNRGAYQTPEIRVPSIRGMVRWWFRALGGNADDEKAAFGGMKGFGNKFKKEVRASSLVFRVSNICAQRAQHALPTLPHKKGGGSSPKPAFVPGAKFNLEVFTRFGNLEPELEKKVTKALEAWTLLGALGLRANRGGGNVWPTGSREPRNIVEFRKHLTEIGLGEMPVMIAGLEVGTTVAELHAACTDTVKGLTDIFGSIHPRLSSPFKFKVVRLADEGGLRLVAFGDSFDMLEDARQALKGHFSRPESWRPI